MTPLEIEAAVEVLNRFASSAINTKNVNAADLFKMYAKEVEDLGETVYPTDLFPACVIAAALLNSKR